MQAASLSKKLDHKALLRRLAGVRADEVVVGVGRDPLDRRRNCIVLYVPPGSAVEPPEFVTLDGERVRVVTRERGGPLLAYGT